MEMQMKTSHRLKLFVSCLVCCGVLALGLAAGHSPAAALVDDGVEIYEARCAGCHGKDGRGSAFGNQNGAPDFTAKNWHDEHCEAELKDAVTNGKGSKMPAWKGKLSASEIEAVVARVRAFGARH